MAISTEFISVTEAAEVVGCTTRRIRQLVESGQIQGAKLHPRAIAVVKSSAEEYAQTKQPVGRPRTGEKKSA